MSKILTLTEIITQAQRLRASDIHIVCGIPIRTRVDGKLHNLDTNVMTAEDCESYARDLSNHYEDISIIGEQDLAVGFPDGSYQTGEPSAVGGKFGCRSGVGISV